MPPTKAITLNNDDAVKLFVDLVKRGVDCWCQAGGVLVAMVENDDLAIEKILHAAPYLNRETLDSFVRMGRREIYPYLALDARPAVKQLARFTYDRQKAIYEMEVEIVTKKDRKLTTETKRFAELTNAEMWMVLTPVGIRSKADQEAMLTKPKKAKTTGFIRTREIARTTLAHKELESLDDDEPKGAVDERADTAIAEAQEAVLRLRTVLSELPAANKKFDPHVTQLLSAIGLLRFKMKEEFAGE